MFAYNFFVGGSGGFQAVRTEYYTIDSDPFVFGLFPVCHPLVFHPISNILSVLQAITRIPIAPIFTEVTPNDIRRHIWDNMPPLIEYDDVPDFPPEHPPADIPGDFPGLRGVAFEDALAEMPILEYDDEDFFGNVRPFFPRIRGRILIPRPPLRALRRRLLLFLPPARGRRPFAEHEHLCRSRKLIV
ncbi:hypothetical protein NLI96_g3947 [Meripilus lineatus]|uniref:Uncharacterized protein n=1 Tax=Meripilus lineatus TaxID=2056292 RepID=A0AAD5YKK0_9APHY|nr:hypothetical protein NLI96_g3947 [Physisporinus lineatus]